MRLDFNVLWIDDYPGLVAQYQERLARRMAALGFELNVVPVTSLAAVEGIVSEHVHDDDIDLVLVDFDLGEPNHQGGEEAAEIVRENLKFKDIIFYSAGDIERLRGLAFEKKIDGIYFSTRTDLVDDTYEVVEALVKKVLDISHMRGIVMAATSDVDHMVERSFLAVVNSLKPDEQETLVDDIFRQIDGFRKVTDERIEKLREQKDLMTLINMKGVLSAGLRLQFLEQLLAAWENDAEHAAKLALLKKYRNEIPGERNKLGHVKIVTKEDGSKVFLGREGVEITFEMMSSLRCSLLEHRKNFTEIQLVLGVVD